jgi:hypothetical protein
MPRQRTFTEPQKRAATIRRWFTQPSTKQTELLNELLVALVADFQEGGAAAIKTLRDSDPLNYLRLITVMVPKPKADTVEQRVSNDDIIDAIATVDRIARSIGEPDLCIDMEALPALPEA